MLARLTCHFNPPQIQLIWLSCSFCSSALPISSRSFILSSQYKPGSQDALGVRIFKADLSCRDLGKYRSFLSFSLCSCQDAPALSWAFSFTLSEGEPWLLSGSGRGTWRFNYTLGAFSHPAVFSPTFTSTFRHT